MVGGLVLFAATAAVLAQNMGDKDFDASQYNVNAQFLAFAKRGESERVLRMLERGAAVNARNRNGETALMMYAKRGDTEMVRTLLAHGADPNLPALDRTTPLMASVYACRMDIATPLLDGGARTEDADQLGKTAMVYAAGTGCEAAVVALLARGVDVNARYRHALTALMWAAGAGHADAVRALLARGADAGLTDDRGKRAEDIAREADHADIADILAKSAVEGR